MSWAGRAPVIGRGKDRADCMERQVLAYASAMRALLYWEHGSTNAALASIKVARPMAALAQVHCRTEWGAECRAAVVGDEDGPGLHSRGRAGRLADSGP